MDETIRIYNPSVKPNKNTHLRKTEPKWKYFFDKDVWLDIFKENADREYDLEQKYPWFEILHRWIIALCVVGLFISFGIWGINIYTERTAQERANTVAAQKDEEHRAYIAQQEADRRAAEESLENLMKANASVKAKLGYGSRNFVDKYHYGDADFMTLYQCVDNRLKNSMYAGMTIEDIVFQEGQFIASYDTNPLDNYYFNLAMKSERLKHDREAEQIPEPVGSDYVYAIYTQHGIYLANDPKAPAYTWWHWSE